MTDRELLEGIFLELKEVRKDIAGLRTDVNGLRTDVDGLRTDVDELRTDMDGLRTDIDRLDKKVEVQNEILMTFKYDIDFISEKQAKQDLKINRISKQLEVY
ncbi:hypothetical protein QNH39_18005 [Neobacillus novalis]|uniref:Uncharacterized protein n=1 Tax=Neobacillus novalis TaxID=220687 RepID=A0AA95MIQ0_9BACI|nr:hypothetical protein [Neobacillus novalis]WHY84544.1 hypothetical protein QNH39_18005 [Neobacillus novalis]